MTQLKVFQGGLSQGCALPERPGWQHADNGFSSREAMDRLHEPIVDLARSTLSGQTGNVLDLGCGNGMLLSKVCDGTRVIPFGVDTSKRAIEHARTILPAFSSNFVESDLLAFGSWNGRPYVLSLLMLGRLKEIGKTNAARLIAELKSKSKEVIVYLYPDWRDQKLGEMADELGVRVSELADQNVGFLLFS
jgi:trans-aconitate methyltransferase